MPPDAARQLGRRSPRQMRPPTAAARRPVAGQRSARAVPVHHWTGTEATRYTSGSLTPDFRRLPAPRLPAPPPLWPPSQDSSRIWPSCFLRPRHQGPRFGASTWPGACRRACYYAQQNSTRKQQPHHIGLFYFPAGGKPPTAEHRTKFDKACDVL